MSFIATTLQAGVLIAVTALSLRIAEVGKTEIRNNDFMKRTEIKFDLQTKIAERQKSLELKPLLVFFNNANQEKINGFYKIVEVKKIGKDTTEADIHRTDRSNIRRIELVPAERDVKFAEIEIIHREETDKVAEERTTHEILSIREEERDIIRHGESSKRFVVELFNKLSEGKFEVYTLELHKRIQEKEDAPVSPVRFATQTQVKPSLATKSNITNELTLELKEVMGPKGKVVRDGNISGEVEVKDGKLMRVFASVETPDGRYREITPSFEDETKAHNQFAYRATDIDGAGMANGALSGGKGKHVYFLYFSSGPYKGYRLKYETPVDENLAYEEQLKEEEAKYAYETRRLGSYEDDGGYQDDYVTEADEEEVNDRQVAAIAGRNQVARGIQRLQAEDGEVVQNFNESPSAVYVNDRIDALYEKAEMDIDSLSTAELEVLANLEELQEAEGGYNFSNF